MILIKIYEFSRKSIDVDIKAMDVNSISIKSFVDDVGKLCHDSPSQRGKLSA